MYICDHLSKSFDADVVLSDLTLSFPKKGITAIIGPNGAGKTTLLNIMSGFLRPTTGRCLLYRTDVTQLSPFRVSQLGVARTFQDLRLVREATALENLLLARPHQRGESFTRAVSHLGIAKQEAHNREKATAILHTVGLEKDAQTVAGYLSYGQQKLLTVACCVATEATTLLFDEPVAGVSQGLKERVINYLFQLRDSGKMVILIEHDLETVRTVADHVAVLDAGRLIAFGTRAQVFSGTDLLEVYLG